MSHLSVVAVVVTFNREKLLNKVLNALVNQDYPLLKIIIIDNGSKDGTELMIKSFSDKYCGLIHYNNTHANLGGAGGFHKGMDLAGLYDYDYVWLMDDDFMPNQDCLTNLVGENLQGIIQPMRFNLDGTNAELSALTYDVNTFFKIKPKGESVKDYVTKNKIGSSAIPVEAVPFEGPLIHKNVVKSVGLPEPRFFIFGDDTDYCLRSLKNGFSIVCSPKAKATRLLVNNQSNDLLSWKGYFMLRNMFYLYSKHGSGFSSKLKPFLIAAGYLSLSLARLKFSQLPVVFAALRDFSTLSNNDRYKPK